MTSVNFPKTARDAAWNILIIEDDVEDFLIARDLLAEAREQTITAQWAPSYAAGRDALLSGSYTAALVDYDLGAQSGVELIREANARGVAVPLILFTGHGRYQADLEAMQAGATLYLAKKDMNALLLERSIRYAVERKQIENQLQASNERLSKALANRETAEEALVKTEERYRNLFESIDEGFCIIEVIFDENQHPIDYRFLEVNGVFEKQTGIRDAVGKRMRQIAPEHEDYWFEIYGKVALTGEAVRFENNAGALNRFYEVYAFPASRAPQRNVAILFTDITERKQNEEKLRESREMLERSQQLAHLGSWELDLVRDQLSWSDEVYRIFGMLPQEFGATYEAFLERVHPEDRAAVDTSYTQSLRENRDTYEIEHRVIRAGSGEVRYVHEKCEHFRDETGKIIRSVGMVHDITERKRAEDEARRSNEALRQLSQAVEQSPASVVITDITGRIEYVNPQFTKLTGYTLDEARGKNPNILKSGRTPPEQYRSMWKTILAGSDWKGEFANRKKNGDLYWEAVSVSPITDEDGKVTHFVAVKEDITERKQAEQALRDAHDYAAWMARLSEENPNPVVRVSADGVVLFRNPTAAEQPGWDCVVGQRLPEPLLQLVERAAQQAQTVQEDLQLADHVYAISVTPLFENRYANLYGSDITMRKKAESALAETAVKLERSNRELEQFAFVASHDLQEPLRKIKMFGERLVEMLQDDCPADARDYLQRMQKATGRMQTMINGLLELSRVNTRGGSFSGVWLEQVAQDALSDLELRVQAAGGKVIIDELPTIQADEMQMRQLFQNLIGNAIKFHHPDVPPVVRLSAAARSSNGASTVTIRVADNGIGFEQLYAERIFQPFQRLHGRNEYEGTGLGLAICQKIVERHQGEIKVQSAPDEGATFLITLPVKQER